MENSRVLEILDGLDSIFENANIYQSIIFIDNDNMQDMYDHMCERDYPVVQYNDEKGIQNFIECNSRCLLVGTDELCQVIEKSELWAHVNMVVSCTNSITAETLRLDNKRITLLVV